MKRYYITEQFIFVQNHSLQVHNERGTHTIYFTGDVYVNQHRFDTTGDLCGRKIKDQVAISLPEDTICIIF